MQACIILKHSFIFKLNHFPAVYSPEFQQALPLVPIALQMCNLFSPGLTKTAGMRPPMAKPPSAVIGRSCS